MRAEFYIQTALRGHTSFLKKAFFTQPFKIADITEDQTAGILRLMLMSSSPGILDEDEYRAIIEVAGGSVLELQTQSYQRLFTMKKGATQQMEVQMSPHSAFCFLPHPVVPHAGARFDSRNKIFVSEGCRLIWGEVLTCGRKRNGEVFHFSRYHALTEIYLCGKLVIKENLLMEPVVLDASGMGIMEGYTHQANLIYLNESIDVAALRTSLSGELQKKKEILSGITSPFAGALLVRLLGQDAEPLHECLKLLAGHLPLKKSIGHVPGQRQFL